MSHAGLGVLAVAHEEVPSQPAYSAADESGLILSGYVSFADPLLPGMHEKRMYVKIGTEWVPH